MCQPRLTALQGPVWGSCRVAAPSQIICWYPIALMNLSLRDFRQQRVHRGIVTERRIRLNCFIQTASSLFSGLLGLGIDRKEHEGRTLRWSKGHGESDSCRGLSAAAGKGARLLRPGQSGGSQPAQRRQPGLASDQTPCLQGRGKCRCCTVSPSLRILGRHACVLAFQPVMEPPFRTIPWEIA